MNQKSISTFRVRAKVLKICVISQEGELLGNSVVAEVKEKLVIFLMCRYQLLTD